MLGTVNVFDSRLFGPMNILTTTETLGLCKCVFYYLAGVTLGMGLKPYRMLAGLRALIFGE